MNKKEIKNIIQSFIHLIEEGKGDAAQNESELIQVLDALAYAIHFAQYKNNDAVDTADPERKQYEDDRLMVKRRFEDFGHYNRAEYVLTKVGESEVLVGDAIDDLADIYGELKEVLWRWKHNGVDDAFWYFRSFYYYHWQNHLRSLQSYLVARMNAD